jgi:hypothetical protein
VFMLLHWWHCCSQLLCSLSEPELLTQYSDGLLVVWWMGEYGFDSQSKRDDIYIYIYIYIFVNCNWVATRWQLFSTHIHTNNTGNVTKQTIQRTQKYMEQHKKYI